MRQSVPLVRWVLFRSFGGVTELRWLATSSVFALHVVPFVELPWWGGLRYSRGRSVGREESGSCRER